MSSRHIETERTYDLADAATALPDLVGATGGIVHTVTDVGTDELEATYVDTDDLQLIRHRVTLRRRTGGPDAGWHLKLPVQGDTRQEIHWPLGDSDELPDEVRRAVTALAPGADLQAVVRLSTSRRRSLLADEAGLTLAELCDDHVRATLLQPDSAVTVWREVEVELVDGSVSDLDAVEQALQAVGAVRAATSSKLARAVSGHPAFAGNETRSARTDSSSPPGTDPRTGRAGNVFTAYLRQQVDRLRWADVELRVDPAGEGVHDLRVQARRLRTALKVNRPLLDEAVGRHLEHELKLLGRALSPVRDRQVAHELLAHLVQARPDNANHLLSLFDRQEEAADERSEAGMRSALDSPRYVQLLTDLDALAGGQGLSELAAQPPRAVLTAHLRHALHRLEKDARAVDTCPPAERTTRLHDLRKSAKSLRYACELVEPVEGDAAERLGRRAKRLQTLLGEHLDQVQLVEQLEPLTRVEGASAADGFLLGVLHAELTAAIAAGSKAQRKALRRVRSPKATQWLRSA